MPVDERHFPKDGLG